VYEQQLTKQNRYIQIARLAAAKNDFTFATRAAEKSLDVYKTCLGMDSKRTKDAEKSVRAFRNQISEVKTITTAPKKAGMNRFEAK
jgi:hypothetical protein